jgi:hypothetical protein
MKTSQLQRLQSPAAALLTDASARQGQVVDSGFLGELLTAAAETSPIVVNRTAQPIETSAGQAEHPFVLPPAINAPSPKFIPTKQTEVLAVTVDESHQNTAEVDDAKSPILQEDTDISQAPLMPLAEVVAAVYSAVQLKLPVKDSTVEYTQTGDTSAEISVSVSSSSASPKTTTKILKALSKQMENLQTTIGESASLTFGMQSRNGADEFVPVSPEQNGSEQTFTTTTVPTGRSAGNQAQPSGTIPTGERKQVRPTLAEAVIPEGSEVQNVVELPDERHVLNQDTVLNHDVELNQHPELNQDTVLNQDVELNQHPELNQDTEINPVLLSNTANSSPKVTSEPRNEKREATPVDSVLIPNENRQDVAVENERSFSAEKVPSTSQAEQTSTPKQTAPTLDALLRQAKEQGLNIQSVVIRIESHAVPPVGNTIASLDAPIGEAKSMDSRMQAAVQPLLQEDTTVPRVQQHQSTNVHNNQELLQELTNESSTALYAVSSNGIIASNTEENSTDQTLKVLRLQTTKESSAAEKSIRENVPQLQAQLHGNSTVETPEVMSTLVVSPQIISIAPERNSENGIVSSARYTMPQSGLEAAEEPIVVVPPMTNRDVPEKATLKTPVLPESQQEITGNFTVNSQNSTGENVHGSSPKPDGISERTSTKSSVPIPQNTTEPLQVKTPRSATDVAATTRSEIEFDTQENVQENISGNVQNLPPTSDVISQESTSNRTAPSTQKTAKNLQAEIPPNAPVITEIPLPKSMSGIQYNVQNLTAENAQNISPESDRYSTKNSANPGAQNQRKIGENLQVETPQNMPINSEIPLPKSTADIQKNVQNLTTENVQNTSPKNDVNSTGNLNNRTSQVTLKIGTNGQAETLHNAPINTEIQLPKSTSNTQENGQNSSIENAQELPLKSDVNSTGNTNNSAALNSQKNAEHVEFETPQNVQVNSDIPHPKNTIGIQGNLRNSTTENVQSTSIKSDANSTKIANIPVKQNSQNTIKNVPVEEPQNTPVIAGMSVPESTFGLQDKVQNSTTQNAQTISPKSDVNTIGNLNNSVAQKPAGNVRVETPQIAPVSIETSSTEHVVNAPENVRNSSIKNAQIASPKSDVNSILNSNNPVARNSQKIGENVQAEAPMMAPKIAEIPQMERASISQKIEQNSPTENEQIASPKSNVPSPLNLNERTAQVSQIIGENLHVETPRNAPVIIETQHTEGAPNIQENMQNSATNNNGIVLPKSEGIAGDTSHAEVASISQKTAENVVFETPHSASERSDSSHQNNTTNSQNNELNSTTENQRVVSPKSNANSIANSTIETQPIAQNTGENLQFQTQQNTSGQTEILRQEIATNNQGISKNSTGETPQVISPKSSDVPEEVSMQDGDLNARNIPENKPVGVLGDVHVVSENTMPERDPSVGKKAQEISVEHSPLQPPKSVEIPQRSDAIPTENIQSGTAPTVAKSVEEVTVKSSNSTTQRAHTSGKESVLHHEEIAQNSTEEIQQLISPKSELISPKNDVIVEKKSESVTQTILPNQTKIASADAPRTIPQNGALTRSESMPNAEDSTPTPLPELPHVEVSTPAVIQNATTSSNLKSSTVKSDNTSPTVHPLRSAAEPQESMQAEQSIQAKVRVETIPVQPMQVLEKSEQSVEQPKQRIEQPKQRIEQPKQSPEKPLQAVNEEIASTPSFGTIRVEDKSSSDVGARGATVPTVGIDPKSPSNIQNNGHVQVEQATQNAKLNSLENKAQADNSPHKAVQSEREMTQPENVRPIGTDKQASTESPAQRILAEDGKHDASVGQKTNPPSESAVANEVMPIAPKSTVPAQRERSDYADTIHDNTAQVVDNKQHDSELAPVVNRPIQSENTDAKREVVLTNTVNESTEKFARNIETPDTSTLPTPTFQTAIAGEQEAGHRQPALRSAARSLKADASSENQSSRAGETESASVISTVRPQTDGAESDGRSQQDAQASADNAAHATRQVAKEQKKFDASTYEQVVAQESSTAMAESDEHVVQRSMRKKDNPGTSVFTGAFQQPIAPPNVRNYQSQLPQNRSLPRISAENFATSAVQMMQTMPQQSGGSMRLQLAPEALGTVTMQLNVRDKNAVVRLEVETTAAKQALEAQIPLLREQLGQQGITADKIDIQVRQREDFSMFSGFNQQNGSARQEEQEARQSYLRSLRTDTVSESRIDDKPIQVAPKPVQKKSVHQNRVEFYA